jgi:hypothetical protein
MHNSVETVQEMCGMSGGVILQHTFNFGLADEAIVPSGIAPRR